MPSEERAGTPGKSAGKEEKKSDNIEMDDEYEKISDTELDLFDDDDDVYKPPPAETVIDIDWSLLSSVNKAEEKRVESDEPAYRKRLSPGAVLAKIGFAPTLLSKETLNLVQDKVLAASNLSRDQLTAKEATTLNSGLAGAVQACFRQRQARVDLIQQRLGRSLGLRSDLAVRRELQKPMHKVGSRFDVFCSPPSAPADKETFLQAAALLNKKSVGEGDPVYVTIPSKVGSFVMCKS